MNFVAYVKKTLENVLKFNQRLFYRKILHNISCYFYFYSSIECFSLFDEFSILKVRTSFWIMFRKWLFRVFLALLYPHGLQCMRLFHLSSFNLMVYVAKFHFGSATCSQTSFVLVMFLIQPFLFLSVNFIWRIYNFVHVWFFEFPDLSSIDRDKEDELNQYFGIEVLWTFSVFKIIAVCQTIWQTARQIVGNCTTLKFFDFLH